MLTKGDEYPIHQTPEPVAFSGSDRNFYDRFFFNGYSADGSVFFAAAFGVYPHLNVMDGAVSILKDGVQKSIHVSRLLGMERMDTQVGPLSVSVEEPLKRIRLRLEETEGIALDVEFTGRHFPIEEPRFTYRQGPRMLIDCTRMTQNGHWQGALSVDGEQVEVKDFMGTRDRSWGVRPIGARDPQPMPGTPMPAFFWQWTPINFENGSLFFHVNNDEHGNAWNTRAAWAPDGADAAHISEGAGSMRTRLEAGTRWPNGGTLSLAVSGAPEQITFDPVGRFQMKGLGYFHPEWGQSVCDHGRTDSCGHA